MEENGERRGYSIAMWTAWVFLTVFAYVMSGVPIVLLSGLGYLDWMANTSFERVFIYYCMPLEMFAQNFAPYKSLLEFIYGLVA